MRRKSPSLQRKRRTREHVIADLSVNHVERHVLLCGYTAERITHDYGLDLILNTYTVLGEIEAGEVYLQLKATDRLQTVSGGRAICVRIERPDIYAWLRKVWPVILILYDAQADLAYWIYVQAHFSRQSDLDLRRLSAHVTVHIPRTSLVDQDAIRTFARFRDNVRDPLKGVIHHHE